MRFVDIAVLATNMKTANQCLTPINIEENPHAITQKIYGYYPGIDITINFYDTDAQDDELDGMYTRYNNIDESVLFDIDIRSNLNRCWRRFVAAKELSHTILDRDHTAFTTDVHALATLLLNQAPDITNDEDIHSEYLAFYFAVELLVPYSLNGQVSDNSKTSYEIASLLSVPEQIIDLVRTDWYQKLRVDSYDTP